jgi:hypothetical protein
VPFALDTPGGTLTLLDGDAVIDSVHTSRAAAGSSEGRTAAGEIVFFARPTPGAPNDPSPPATFAEWMTVHGVTAAADDDQDGHPSFAEFASGTNPRDGASVIRPRVARAADGSLHLSFVIPQPARAGVIHRVESTTSLTTGPWTAIATKSGTAAWTGSATVTTGPSEGGFEAISVRLTPAPGTNTFLRLHFLGM